MFNAADGGVISSREFSEAYNYLDIENKALLINSAGTSGFYIDYFVKSDGESFGIFKYDPMSST